MRVPLSWLKEFIPLHLSPQEIAQKLTMIGLEVDSIEMIGESLDKVVVVHILEATKHPNADKLTIAKVTDGKQEYQIVCGAPNCRAGLKTALALEGATLKEGDQTFTIKKSKIRGVDSQGMMCTGKELGLSEEDDGIIEFPATQVEGTLLSDLYSDAIFEVSLTPNLAHCNSIMGVARELAAAMGLSFLVPPTAAITASAQAQLTVKVLDSQTCPRYACCLIQNVQIKPAPEWITKRLSQCGIRSVNNIVDITNYVMHELGHPLHAFDYQEIQGQEIIVRQAAEGESILTLDGKERALKNSMLLICDKNSPLAIAGVMGGLNSEVKESTQNIVLESAYFNPVSVRRTSKQLNLLTEASKRFERGTDPNQVLLSLQRAVSLIQEVAGGNVTTAVIDVKEKLFSEISVTCRLSRINRLLGTILGVGEVDTIFKNLQFDFQWDGNDLFTVQIPTYRSDVRSEIDLIEEVARFYGYDNIVRQGGRYLSSTLPPAPIYAFEEDIRTRLIGEGLQEFLTCDLVGPTLLQVVHDGIMPPETLIKVLNPTSIEQSVLRTSLLPGLLQVVKYNHDHQNHQVAGFEIGHIHFRSGDNFSEQPVVGIVLSGKSNPHHWQQKPEDYDFFDLKGIVENLLKELGVQGFQFRNTKLNTFHTGRQASVYIDSLEVGSFGEIHPAIQRRLDVPQRLLFGEFNLKDLMQVARPLDKVAAIAIYPSSERDWTLTIKESVSYKVILDMIQAQPSPLLESVSLKDIYRSDKVSPGYQNITLNFVYRDFSKTIAQEEVEAEHQRLTSAVRQQLSDNIKN